MPGIPPPTEGWGTDTILTTEGEEEVVVVVRAGMKSWVWLGVVRDRRGGHWPDERDWKASAWEWSMAARGMVGRREDMSVEEMRRTMVNGRYGMRKGGILW